MRILMVTAEYAPLAKTGGLADMVTGLSKALAAAGHEVRVVLPRYRGVGPGALAVGGLQVSPVAVAGGHPGYGWYLLGDSDRAAPQVYLVDCPPLFDGAIYGGGEAEARRFALLCHAALALTDHLGWAPDIVHCHDWHAALVPALRTAGYRTSPALRQCRTVLTIHNIGYQGIFPLALAGDLGLGSVPALDAHAELNFLRTGIATADALTTVSPTHAAEILTPEYGKGLEDLLNQRQARLVGILNGVDYSTWDPATDASLPAHYAAGDLAGKAECRRALLQRASLAGRPGVPLLGMVTRLAEQKGIELAIGALEPLLAQGRVQAVVLGQGEERYVRQAGDLAQRFAGDFCYFDAQDEALARLVFGGSDGFLVPSLYEPCGLTQMYALRYGAVPVVRETGGLRDTVRHFDPGSGQGTGSVFKHPDVNGLAWALGELLAWHAQPELWQRVRRNGMACDFSWQHQAPLYAQLYARVAGAPPG